MGEKNSNEISVEASDEAPILRQIGLVLSLRDGIALASGLMAVFLGEVVLFQSGLKGLVLNLEQKYVGIAALGDSAIIKPGNKILRTGKQLRTEVGKSRLGKSVNAVNDRELHASELTKEITFLSISKQRQKDIIIPERPREKRAPGIIPRTSVCEPLQTGITAVDSLIPLGRGQRELIIGDRQIGKTAIAIDAILNQKRNNKWNTIEGFGDSRLYCIYTAIGQKKSNAQTLQKKLESADAYWYTSLVVASAADVSPKKYVAPYTAAARGEFFRDNGRHALTVYDDLSKHADAYRQRSLLLRASPGREAFPGDIFYAHSRLLERAAKLSKRYGYGSLTSLPVIETQAGDVSAYIATNVISITDGQIFLDGELFTRGIKPALNIGLSVSRVGSKAQTSFRKAVSGTLKSDLAQFREIERFAKLSDDLDESIQNILNRGKLSTGLIMVQPHSNPSLLEKQTTILGLLTCGRLDGIVTEEKALIFKANLFDSFKLESMNILRYLTQLTTNLANRGPQFIEFYLNSIKAHAMARRIVLCLS